MIGPPTRARWSYSSSKAVDEFLGLAYHKREGLPVVIFRLFNTVGPRQTGRYGMVVPRFVRQALDGTPLTVYGDGSQTRCFLHVKDAVEAIIGLAKSEDTVGEVFNVGSTEEVSILELARKVLATVSRLNSVDSTLNGSEETDGRIVFVPYEEAYEEGFEDMHRRVPDISKIRRYTGWEPSHSLEEVLQDVISSYRAHEVTVKR